MIKKVRFSITDLANELGISQTKIRFWESYFKIKVDRKKHRGGKQERYYTIKQADKIRKIAKIKKTGLYTLKGIDQLFL